MPKHFDHGHMVQTSDEPVLVAKSAALAEAALMTAKATGDYRMIFGMLDILTQRIFSDHIIKLGYRTKAFEEWSYAMRKDIEKAERAETKKAKEAKS